MDWKWLETTHRLQVDYYDIDPHDIEGDDLADFISWNVTALIAEVGEFLGEVGWKTWIADRGHVNRTQAVNELVDAGHFLANLLSALRVTDEEWETLYQSKQEINRQRMRSGTYAG